MRQKSSQISFILASLGEELDLGGVQGLGEGADGVVGADVCHAGEVAEVEDSLRRVSHVNEGGDEGRRSFFIDERGMTEFREKS